MIAPRRRRRRGLTLIEVVLASSVLAIIMLGVFSALNASQRADMLTRERQAISAKVSEMLDTMLSVDPPAAGEGWALPFDVTLDAAETVKVKGLTTDPVVAATWTWSLGPVPSPITSGGVAAVRAGVDTSASSGDAAANVDLVEARVVFAWRPADGQPAQRIEMVGRRIR